MPRDLILGTAGHIDHGKTALVKALTGIDCDRLPEEKSRGITIDIGFAHLELGDIHLGIVDVPGHERFIKNMLAGAAGIDIALLVVAADDSVMPQTREHLDILKLLGVRRGVIALTKTDLVDETTREVAALEVRELVQGSFLGDAAIIPTSANTGAGIEELKAALKQISGTTDGPGGLAAAAPGDSPFRMAIDRAFTAPGHGTVVTGSIASGSVKVGDELDWHSGRGHIEKVRIRSLNHHNQAVESAHRGQRAALNLAGAPIERVRRGQELAAPDWLLPGKVLTVRVAASTESHRPIKHRLPVRLHIGTAEVMAAVSLLDADRIEPGQSGLAQLFLEEHAATIWGQPFVLRDSSAEHTLGGGQVLQPAARKIRRRNKESLERLAQLYSPDADERILAAAWFEEFRGISTADLSRKTGLSRTDLDARLDRLTAEGRLVRLHLASYSKLTLHVQRLEELETRVLDALASLHAENPLAASHDRQKLLARFEYLGNETLLRGVLDRLVERKQAIGEGSRIAHAGFKPKLSTNQRKLKDQIVSAIASAGFQPPEPREFANQAGGNAGVLRDIFAVAVAEGSLVKITEELYLSTEAERELWRRVVERLERAGATVSEIRELLGTTRKFAVPLCEYLDRIGVTRRQGDLRSLAPNR